MDTTKRFTQTVEHYAKYRPSYPAELMELLLAKNIIGKDKIIADVGSGTGIFSKLLLDAGSTVIGVEPNDAMRYYAESQLSANPHYKSMNATAENTTLDDHSMDAISAATAFHWFDAEACRKEFQRILKPQGYVILVWNLRLKELSPVTAGYEAILKKHCPDYSGIPSLNRPKDEIQHFFDGDSYETYFFENKQVFDLDGMIGRLRSTSYALTPDQPGYDAMIEDITKLFHDNEENGSITYDYKTKLSLGRLR